MYLPRFLSLALTLLLLLPTALLAQDKDKPDYDDPRAVVDECIRLHMLGQEDAVFVAQQGKEHHAAWKKAAEAGDARAQWLWGRCVQEGVVGQAKPVDAIKWYRKAADKKEGLAMNELGVNYEKGIGVPANMRAAITWYRRARDNGCGRAAINLGRMLMEGKTGERDYLEAAKVYLGAAEGGYSEGARQLGAIAEFGRGLPADKKLATRWYREAVAMGNVEAKTDLQRVEGASGKTDDQPPPAGDKPPISGGKTPPAGDKPPAAGGKPPSAGDKPPPGPQFRGRPIPGIAKHPLGPAGFNGPAPIFAGEWRATLRNEDKGKDEAVSYTFDAKGTPVWRGKVMTEVGQELVAKPISKPGDGFQMLLRQSLQYISVQPDRVEFTLWETLDYSTGSFSNKQMYLKRFIFTPVPGNPDRLRMELWVDTATRPTLHGELTRVKRDGD